MANKFGLLGELNVQLSRVQQRILHAVVKINTVRGALQHGAVCKGKLSEARAAELLVEAEKLLDELIQE